MLAPDTLPLLEGTRNLLAFSGGSDSTALFFLLCDAGIDFDIALVNYHTRPQSDDEARYALTLAKEYGKACFIHDAYLESRNFEHEARRARYDFFEHLIGEHGYENLLTAHQLDDRLEWLLMQLCKGSGALEMAGMKAVQPREAYTLVRPLLQCTKAQLQKYLKERGATWFEDTSNDDPRYRRNDFRRRFAAPMLQEYAEGIRKSFSYLDEDVDALEADAAIHRTDALWWFENPHERRALLRTVDRVLKQAGYLLRQGERARLKEEETLVVGRRFAVAIGKRYTFIAPYEEATMPKPFKEHCRILGIDPKLRPYLSRATEAFEAVASLLVGDAVDLHGE